MSAEAPAAIAPIPVRNQRGAMGVGTDVGTAVNSVRESIPKRINREKWAASQIGLTAWRRSDDVGNLSL